VVAVALERSRFVEIARETEIKHSAEALRSSILSALSHDLRTPLTALVGMADTLALGKLPAEKQRPMLEAIRNQTLSISHQMTNLLEMARLSEGKFQLNTAWQPIEEVLGATLHQAKMQWKERVFDLDLAAELPPIKIDAVLMERVFWNLIENAVKYSPEGEQIGISIVRAGEVMEISVCDRGPGIPANRVAGIFETFQRGRVESDIPGVGLGLSIARTIVAAHGGELAYQPRSGGGSCFTVRLPLEQVPAYDAMDEMP
jgi:two-component system sensor histidine kinase KdpD